MTQIRQLGPEAFGGALGDPVRGLYFARIQPGYYGGLDSRDGKVLRRYGALGEVLSWLQGREGITQKAGRTVDPATSFLEECGFRVRHPVGVPERVRGAVIRPREEPVRVWEIGPGGAEREITERKKGPQPFVITHRREKPSKEGPESGETTGDSPEANSWNSREAGTSAGQGEPAAAGTDEKKPAVKTGRPKGPTPMTTEICNKVREMIVAGERNPYIRQVLHLREAQLYHAIRRLRESGMLKDEEMPEWRVRRREAGRKGAEAKWGSSETRS